MKDGHGGQILRIAAPAFLCAVVLACSLSDLPMRTSIVDLGFSWKEVGSFHGDTAASGPQYGVSVSISGAKAAVGCPGEASGAGAVYLYEKNGTWVFKQKLSGPALSLLGRSVSLNGSTLLVGAPGVSSGAGAAYVYVQDPNTGTWGSPITLTAPGGASNAYFGLSVALTDSWAFVGAPNADSSKGLAYVFYKDSGGAGKWGAPNTAITLKKASQASGDFFGAAICVSGSAAGSYAAIGSPQDTIPPSGGSAGAVGLYYFNGSQWGDGIGNPTTTLSESGTNAYGASVAISSGASGNTLAVGSPGNESAYVYTRSGSSWSGVRLSDPNGVAGDLFGVSVAVSDSGILVGSAFDDGKGADSGSLFAFARYGSEWKPDAPLWAKVPAANALYGWAVAASADRVVVGAYGNDLIEGSASVLEKLR